MPYYTEKFHWWFDRKQLCRVMWVGTREVVSTATSHTCAGVHDLFWKGRPWYKSGARASCQCCDGIHTWYSLGSATCRTVMRSTVVSLHSWCSQKQMIPKAIQPLFQLPRFKVLQQFPMWTQLCKQRYTSQSREIFAQKRRELSQFACRVLCCNTLKAVIVQRFKTVGTYAGMYFLPVCFCAHNFHDGWISHI